MQVSRSPICFLILSPTVKDLLDLQEMMKTMLDGQQQTQHDMQQLKELIKNLTLQHTVASSVSVSYKRNRNIGKTSLNVCICLINE